jgi:sugar phosphate permease
MPAVILIAWALVDLWLIRETPENAGFPYLETHDASHGLMHETYTTLDLLKKVFLNPLMLMLGGVELTAGVLRNGIMQWYTIFAHQVPQPGAEGIIQQWGLLLCLFGITGGFAGGLISDKFFQSRRGPPTAIFCASMLMLAAVMAMTLFSRPFIVGVAALFIVAAVTGVHSLMSGTAAADFGGRKATATCSGVVDGCVYLGSSVQSVSVGYLVGLSWLWWPIFLMPFALAGGVVSAKIWHAGRDAKVHRRTTKPGQSIAIRAASIALAVFENAPSITPAADQFLLCGNSSEIMPQFALRRFLRLLFVCPNEGRSTCPLHESHGFAREFSLFVRENVRRASARTTVPRRKAIA